MIFILLYIALKWTRNYENEQKMPNSTLGGHFPSNLNVFIMVILDLHLKQLKSRYQQECFFDLFIFFHWCLIDHIYAKIEKKILRNFVL